MADTIHLQGIGRVQAKPAIEFKEGELMTWNYGYKSKVLAIIKTSKDFITFAISGNVGEENEKESYSRRLKKSRLVGCSE